jgi:hypothetical protein
LILWLYIGILFHFVLLWIGNDANQCCICTCPQELHPILKLPEFHPILKWLLISILEHWQNLSRISWNIHPLSNKISSRCKLWNFYGVSQNVRFSLFVLYSCYMVVHEIKIPPWWIKITRFLFFAWTHFWNGKVNFELLWQWWESMLMLAATTHNFIKANAETIFCRVFLVNFSKNLRNTFVV